MTDIETEEPPGFDPRWCHGHYRLVDGEPVEERDLMAWARWFENTDRKLARDEIDGFQVSTVFLGLDHNHSGEGPPILWETMVFGRREPGEESPFGLQTEYDMGGLDQERYSTREAALEGHAAAVARIRRIVGLVKDL